LLNNDLLNFYNLANIELLKNNLILVRCYCGDVKTNCYFCCWPICEIDLLFV